MKKKFGILDSQDWNIQDGQYRIYLSVLKELKCNNFEEVWMKKQIIEWMIEIK